MSMTLKPEQKIAQKVIQRHALRPPIDVLSLLQEYADYEEDVIPYGVDAVCILNSNRPHVILNKKIQNQNRKRFTLAHELGHIVIPWHVGMFSCHTESKNLFNEAESQYYMMEDEANNFAAELLMPSPWMNKIVQKYESYGLDEVLNKITEEVVVSLTAAFFTVFNYLPPGYVGFFKNKDRDYGKRLESKGTNVVIPKKGDIIDIGWMDNVASDLDSYSTESFVIYWWKFDQVSDEQISDALRSIEKHDLNYVFDLLIDENHKAIASIFNPLIERLPLGYVLIFQGTEYERIYYSPGTNVSVPTSWYGYDKEWLNSHSSEVGKYNIFQYTIYWWKFAVSRPQAAKSQDKRLSPEILKQILTESYDNEEERKRAMYRINGIIGNLNNRKPDTFDDYYALLKLRLTGEIIFKEMVVHDKFEDFIINKINELLKKRN